MSSCHSARWCGPCQAEGRELIRVAAERLPVSYAQLVGKARHEPLVTYRHYVMWLIRQQGCLSLPAIGRLFGGRDHTTVLHAVRKIDGMRSYGDGALDELDRLLHVDELDPLPVHAGLTA